MKAILLDIEGTTTPISFVHETLFPYAKARVPGFILDNLSDLKFEIDQLAEEHANDSEYQNTFDRDSANSVADYLRYLIDNDRKSTPLKSIQGMIWQSGYESGELVSPVFDDVPVSLRQWRADDKTVAIFSSGSVLAQKLLFGHTTHGDLTQFISKYFDTTSGAKGEPESYTAIAAEIEIDPSEILFVSDIAAELDAARAAGLRTSLSARPGNATIKQDCIHPVIESFDKLD